MAFVQRCLAARVVVRKADRQKMSVREAHAREMNSVGLDVVMLVHAEVVSVEISAHTTMYGWLKKTFVREVIASIISIVNQVTARTRHAPLIVSIRKVRLV